MDNNALFRKIVALTAAVHQITNEMNKDAKSEAVTPVQFKLLEFVAVNQPVTLSEISECMLISMPNTSRELKKLTDKQLCEKTADGEDRRKQYIRLSEKGELLMGEAFSRMESIMAKRMERASEEELREIDRAIDLIHRKVFY